jgi:hypothetical protein
MVERPTARRRLPPSSSLLPSSSEYTASNAAASRRSLTSRSALNRTTQQASKSLSLSSTSNTHARLLSTVADCIVLGSQLPDPILPYDINSLFRLEPVGAGTHLAASYCIGTDEGNTPDIFVPSLRLLSSWVQDEDLIPQQMRLLSALSRIDNNLPFPPHDTSIVWLQHLTVSHRRVLIPLFLSASKWFIIDVEAPDHVTLHHSKLSQDMIHKAEELTRALLSVLKRLTTTAFYHAVFGPLELKEQPSPAEELGVLGCVVLVTVLRLRKPLFIFDSLSPDATLLACAASMLYNLQLANSLPSTAGPMTLPDFICQFSRKRRAVEAISLLTEDDDDLDQPPQKRHGHIQTMGHNGDEEATNDDDDDDSEYEHNAIEDEDNAIEDEDNAIEDEYLDDDNTESEDDNTEVNGKDVLSKANYTSAPRLQFPPLPIEMTGEVPCQYGCPRVSRTVIAALTHRVSCPAKESAFPAQCPWRRIAGCKLRFERQQSLSNHMGKHVRDTRGTFICRGKCGNHYADVYSLVSHEQKCVLVASKPRIKRRKNQPLEFRILLDAVQKPSVIYVARSSGQRAPGSWSSDRDTRLEGLPIWIIPYREDFQRIFADNRPAVLHAYAALKTRHLPSCADRKAMTSKSTSGKEIQHMTKAHRMTAAITKDVQDCPDRPTIVSLGTDAWASDLANIQAYLSRVQTPFTLVICHTSNYVGQENRLSAQDLTAGTSGVWWGSYTSTELLAGLINFDGARPAVQELITTWGAIQEHKNLLSKSFLLQRNRDSLGHFVK